MIVIVILIPQDAFVRTSYPMAGFVIVHGSQQTFPAMAYLMAILIVVIGITQ